MRGLDRISVLGVACLVVAGCYVFQPLESASPGTDVRARLTAEAAVRRSQGFDDPILHYDGVVVESTPDTLALYVLVARSSSTFLPVEIRDTVRLGIMEIQSIMGRQLSATRTALFTVAAGAAAFAVIKGIDAIVGGTDDPGDDGMPTARVPILRWVGSRLQAVFGQTRH
ncbi:MAG: hypothetical protein L0271_22725 [Gemmatimonadetes bacterium]|nr:hypothetical protein [Gemmatimonadota bacterium]